MHRRTPRGRALYARSILTVPQTIKRTHPLPGDPLNQLIGSMLMVGVRGHSASDPRFRADLDACKAAHVGGVILFDVHLPHRSSPRNIVSPAQTRDLCALLRRELGDDLLIGVDQEGGAVARFKSETGFNPDPSPADFATFSSTQRTTAADALVRQVARAGCNLNFAPCVDVVVNPANPVIAAKGRAFSSDPAVVVQCAREVIDAHSRADVASCLKHFPGHGSSTGDTHAGFVDITATWKRGVELTPYASLISTLDARTCTMTAHVFHAGIDADHPASLSTRHTTSLLRNELGYQGAIVTDSLDMGAVTQRYSPDEAIVLAINAGADILLDGCNAPGPDRPCPAWEMHESIAKALRDGRIIGGEDRLRASAARIARLLGR